MPVEVIKIISEKQVVEIPTHIHHVERHPEPVNLIVEKIVEIPLIHERIKEVKTISEKIVEKLV